MGEAVQDVSFVAQTLKTAWVVDAGVVTGSLERTLVNICGKSGQEIESSHKSYMELYILSYVIEICTYMREYIWIYKHIFIYISKYTYIHIHIYLNIYTYIDTYISKYMYIYIHTYLFICT